MSNILQKILMKLFKTTPKWYVKFIKWCYFKQLKSEQKELRRLRAKTQRENINTLDCNYMKFKI